MAFRLPDVSSGWCCSSSFPQAAEGCLSCAVQLPQHLALPSSGDACSDDGRNKGQRLGGDPTPARFTHSFHSLAVLAQPNFLPLLQELGATAMGGSFPVPVLKPSWGCRLG